MQFFIIDYYFLLIQFLNSDCQLMTCFKEYMPHIRKALYINIMLLVYFFSPSFLFFVTACVAIWAFMPKCSNSIKSVFNCCGDCTFVKCVNKSFDLFKKLPITEELILIVIVRLFIDLIWYIPSWIIIFLAAEIYAIWGFLKQKGIIAQMKKSFQKVLNLVETAIAAIPKYKKL